MNQTAIIEQPAIASLRVRPTQGYNKAAPSYLALVLLVVILALFTTALATFYVPAHQGPDQNAYDVAARMLVEHHRLYFKLSNPWQFMGDNQVLLPNGRVYPKYPPGTSLLAATTWWLGGHSSAMYLMDPLCAVLACAMSFFLFRSLLDDFAALLGVIWLACNPLVLFFANYGDSHGAALLFTVLGFWALLAWRNYGGFWRALLAGGILGFCCWVRYTELLWCLPMLAVALRPWHRSRRRFWEGLSVIAAFALPVAILAGLNWMVFGAPWRTAYALCGEQTGFAWRYFIGNPAAHPPRPGDWRILMDQSADLGLYLLLPFTLLGLVRLFWIHWRMGLMLTLWIIPSGMLYLLYYWAPDNLGYARFFIDLLPALILAGLWLASRAVASQRAATAIGLGLLTLLGAGFNLYHIAPQLLSRVAAKLNLVEARDALRASLPRGSVILADGSMDNYLASIGGYRLYNEQMFYPRFFQKMRRLARHRGPQIIEPLSARHYLTLLARRGPHGKIHAPSWAQLRQDESQIIAQAWRNHKAVAILGWQRGITRFLPEPLGGQARIKVLARWQPPTLHVGRWQSQWALVQLLPKQTNQAAK